MYVLCTEAFLGKQSSATFLSNVEQSGSHFPGRGCVFVCPSGSRRLTGLPILYPEGKLSYCRHSGQDFPAWPYDFTLFLHSEM